MVHIILSIQTYRTHNTKSGPWCTLRTLGDNAVLMEVHQRKKCTLLVGDVDNVVGYACVGAGSGREISVPSSQICWEPQFSSVQLFSHVQLCDPMNCSTPGPPIHHQLPEFTQTHVHRVGEAIQPSHPLSSSSPPAPNPSQHQHLFQWVNSSHEVAKVLEFQL